MESQLLKEGFKVSFPYFSVPNHLIQAWPLRAQERILKMELKVWTTIQRKLKEEKESVIVLWSWSLRVEIQSDLVCLAKHSTKQVP